MYTHYFLKFSIFGKYFVLLRVIRVIMNELPVQFVPKCRQTSSIQMTLILVQLDHRHRPLGNVWVNGMTGHLQMESLDLAENLRRIWSARRTERPALELPLLSLGEHGHDSVPILWLYLVYVVHYFELLILAVLLAMHDDLAVFGRILILKRATLFLCGHVLQLLELGILIN